MLPSLSKMNINAQVANGTENERTVTSETRETFEYFLSTLGPDLQAAAEHMMRTTTGTTILLRLFYLSKGIVSSALTSSTFSALMDIAVRSADFGILNVSVTRLTAIVQALYTFWETQR